MIVPPDHVYDWLERHHYLGGIYRGIAWSDEFGVIVLTSPTSRRLPSSRWVEIARWCLVGTRNGGSQQWARVKRWLVRERPEVTTVVSYSDPSQGHTGALYKACNFVWAPTWHRLFPPPSGNGDWGSGPQSVKDRWIYALRPDQERAAILTVKDGRALRQELAPMTRSTSQRGTRRGKGMATELDRLDKHRYKRREGEYGTCVCGADVETHAMVLWDALAQAQTDLAGAEATAETLRLALAEAERERDAAERRIETTISVCDQHVEALCAKLEQAEQRGRALEGALQWLWWTACHVEVEPVDEKWGTDVRPRTLSEIMTERERAEIRAALTPAECRCLYSLPVGVHHVGCFMALTPPEGSTLCGVKGCTLPSTHGDEPHSWEPPTGGPPPEGSA